MAVRALCESMAVKLMVQLAQELIPDYDLHKRFGSRESISIPTANAAKQIIDDICAGELFPQFVQLLVRAQDTGFRGRKYPIAYLSHLIHGIGSAGYIYDRENGMFIEDSSVRTSPNWGVLREGMDYDMTFLRFDIAGNTRLVRSNPRQKVEKTYQDLFRVVNASLARRNGRMWNFQGDGGLAAFCFSRKDMQATTCAVDVLHELFLYNKVSCILSKPLSVRFAIHSGRCIYNSNTESLKKNDVIKEIGDIEAKYTGLDSITITSKVHVCLDKRISDMFALGREKYIHNLYHYNLCLES